MTYDYHAPLRTTWSSDSRYFFMHRLYEDDRSVLIGERSGTTLKFKGWISGVDEMSLGPADRLYLRRADHLYIYEKNGASRGFLDLYRSGRSISASKRLVWIGPGDNIKPWLLGTEGEFLANQPADFGRRDTFLVHLCDGDGLVVVGRSEGVHLYRLEEGQTQFRGTLVDFREYSQLLKSFLGPLQLDEDVSHTAHHGELRRANVKVASSMEAQIIAVVVGNRVIFRWHDGSTRDRKFPYREPWMYGEQTIYDPLMGNDGRDDSIQSLSFSPDGIYTAILTFRGTLTIVRNEKGGPEVVHQHGIRDRIDEEEYHLNQFLNVDWSPDGELLAIHKWNMASDDEQSEHDILTYVAQDLLHEHQENVSHRHKRQAEMNEKLRNKRQKVLPYIPRRE